MGLNGQGEKGDVYVTRRMVFSAAHRLHHPQQEAEVYGKCSLLHGHNYTIEITVKGQVNPQTGFVIDLKELKELMNERIINVLDHKNIDGDVSYFADRNVVQSSENIAIFIWNQLAEAFTERQGDPAVSLYRVRLYETENNIVEYFG